MELLGITSKYYELYILGDVLDDIGLRNMTMCKLALDERTVPTSGTAHRIWKKTPESSHLRRMLVDRIAMLPGRAYVTDYLALYPADLIVQVAVSLAQDATIERKNVFVAKMPSYSEKAKESD